jgi:hypothetical protein
MELFVVLWNCTRMLAYIETECMDVGNVLRGLNSCHYSVMDVSIFRMTLAGFPTARWKAGTSYHRHRQSTEQRTE